MMSSEKSGSDASGLASDISGLASDISGLASDVELLLLSSNVIASSSAR